MLDRLSIDLYSIVDIVENKIKLLIPLCNCLLTPYTERISVLICFYNQILVQLNNDLFLIKILRSTEKSKYSVCIILIY